MDEWVKANEKKEVEEEFSFKKLFVPLTTLKAIHWIVVIGIIVYANMLFNGFVWDDVLQIESNSYIQHGQFFYYFTHTIGPYYKPLMFFTYTLLFQFFQLNAFPYHFLQLALHIINSILVFFLLKYFFKNNTVSFTLALLFLIHPVNEETVAYIADYQDVLFTFFGLTALLVIYKQTFKKYSNFAITFLLLLSVLSKETGILFIAVNILSSIFFKKQEKIKTIVYSVIAGVLYFIIRFSFIGFSKPSDFTNMIPPNTITSAPFIVRLISVPKIIFFYISSFVFPDNLAVQYWYVKTLNWTQFFLPLLIDLLVFSILIIYGVYLTQKNATQMKTFWFFFIWFCIGLLFHLQIIPLDFTATDRWFYFPMIGLLGMLAVFISQIKNKNSLIKKLTILLVVVIFTIFSVRTVVRNANWYSTISFFQHDLPTMENVADAQYVYGTALGVQGNYNEALVHLKKASLLAPNDDKVWDNLVLTYLHLNQFEQAKLYLTKEIQTKQTTSSTYFTLSYIYIMQKRPNEGIGIAKNALKIWPNDPFLWRILGIGEYEVGNNSLALSDLKESYAIVQLPVTLYYITQLNQNLPLKIKEL
jgi:hypothetical protein